MVYDSEDHVMPILLWESCNKIHHNLLEGKCPFFSGNLVKGDFSSVSKDFVLLTVGASFDVIGYPLVHACPFEYLGGFSNGFVLSWVPGCGVIMDKGHQLLFGGFSGW